jgi:hypothetical protein
MTESETTAASDAGWSRRRWLAAFCGLAAVTATARLAYPHVVRGANLPPLVLPSGLPSLLAQRVKGFHTRYDATFAAHGSTAMRTQIAGDILRFRGQDAWLDALQNWIEFGGWAHAADLSINVAETGGVDVRRQSGKTLLTVPTGLIGATSHGSRIIALHRAETDPTATTYWRELRRRLGI